MRDTPQRLLTRHFFKSLFDFGFLSDAGAESFKKLLLGVSAVAMALGLLLVRILAVKYIGLARSGTPADYQRELTVDHAFLIGVPMWVAAFATVLVGHALFPDETDYRILTPLPVSRATIFRAKLFALFKFAALFVVGSHAALLLMSLITTFHRLAATNGFVMIVVFETVSFMASAFAALAIVALHGVLVIATPRARLIGFSTLVRTTLVCVLVLSLPLLLRLPGTGETVARGAWWLRSAPPMWFVGLERWLVGLPGQTTAVAWSGIAATLISAAIAAVGYAVLYRRFDRVILRPESPHAAPRPARNWPSRRPVRRAILQFASITLRRSVLHQGVIVALAAVAAGFVVNAMLGTDALPRRNRVAVARGASPWLVTWAPMVVMFIAVPAIRLALSIPLELRANWIFRMTEADRTRGDAVGASVVTTLWLGVIAPVVALFPLQWTTLGPIAAPIAVVDGLIGWIYVELLTQDWRRIPFTCSYLPGKTFLPQLVIRSVFGFFFFTGFGTLIAEIIIAVPAAALFAGSIIGIAAIALMVRRRRTARHAPLVFEDQLPMEVNTLRLSVD
ncbi:MAG TPA: hypothetical protein VFV98_05295 [Vicinamibacterales bacterium]|nr:hypothetical protein [Vicinamibacterales bacterium]